MKLFTTIALGLIPLVLLGQDLMLVSEAKNVISVASDKNGGYYFLSRQDTPNTAIFKRNSSGSLIKLVQSADIDISPLTLHSQYEWIAGDKDTTYFPVYDPKTFSASAPKFAHIYKHRNGKITPVLKIGDEISFLALDGSIQKEYFFHAMYLIISGGNRIVLVAATGKKPFGLNKELIFQIFELSNDKLIQLIAPIDKAVLNSSAISRIFSGETTKNNFWEFEGSFGAPTESVYKIGPDRLRKKILSSVDVMNVPRNNRLGILSISTAPYEGGIRTNDDSAVVAYRNPQTGNFHFSRFKDGSDTEESILNAKSIDNHLIGTSRRHAYSNDGSYYFVMDTIGGEGLFKIKDNTGQLLKIMSGQIDGKIEQIVESAGKIYLVTKSGFSGNSIYAVIKPEFGPDKVSGTPGDLIEACSDCISPGLNPELTVNGSRVPMGTTGDKLIYYIPNLPIGVHDAYLQLGDKIKKFTLEILAKPVDKTPVIGLVVNAASFKNEISPCSLATIFGRNLASSTANATTLPLPKKLGGTSVTFDGNPAPIWYVSPDQVNIQVPCELGVPAEVSIHVNTDFGKSALAKILISNKSPAFFNYNNRPIVSREDFSAIDFSVGEAISSGKHYSFWLTGGGSTDPAPKTGEANTLPAQALETPKLTLNGTDTGVVYFGLAPGLVGVYQLVMVVPKLENSENKTIEISGMLSFSNSSHDQTFKILYR